uniref:Uncharacterized protein n=1 Tax=Anopheles minimus TaxID=112268 RepID=A0A182WDG4_9DIPT
MKLTYIFFIFAAIFLLVNVADAFRGDNKKGPPGQTGGPKRGLGWGRFK